MSKIPIAGCRPAVLLLAPLALAACQSARPVVGPEEGTSDPTAPLAAIDSVTLRTHLAELADDRYEGRGTGTPGERMAVEYIAGQMRALGLEGGAPDGSFFQPVPLRGATPVEVSALTLAPASGEPIQLPFVEDFIATTDSEADSVALDGAEMVFVGYGITNPGYEWDDYKGADVRGKVLVMFVNDPPATPDEPALFQADTLTYNGRWTYKYEEARRRGARGVFLIHTEPTASYPFTVLSGDARGEHYDVEAVPEGALDVRGWITQGTAERLAQMSGATLDEWFARAARRDFQPQPLPVRASLAMTFTHRRGVTGTNVVGVLRGREEPGEAVVYTAHHDHLGKNNELIEQGQDGIFNGAVDNASGVAMMLALAKAFVALPEQPRRSVYFVTLSAEESGLLGSAHYAANPPVPLARTIANVNVDSGNLLGRTEDLTGIGAERSELLALLREAAAAEGMTVSPDPTPNAGRFFRSDQLAFARGGVPAVFIGTGRRFVGRDAEFAARAEQDYRQNRYHQPADEFAGTELFGGLVQQTRVAFRLGLRLADSDLRPQWRPSEPFAETRRASEAAGLTDEP